MEKKKRYTPRPHGPHVCGAERSLERASLRVKRPLRGHAFLTQTRIRLAQQPAYTHNVTIGYISAAVAACAKLVIQLGDVNRVSGVSRSCTYRYVGRGRLQIVVIVRC